MRILYKYFKPFLIAIFMFINYTIYGQSMEFIISEINWSNWEIVLKKEDKMKIVRRINNMDVNICPNEVFLENVINDFHIVDLNLDWNFDVIYSGNTHNSEKTKTCIWINIELNEFELVLSKEGKIKNISYTIPGKASEILIVSFPNDKVGLELVRPYNLQFENDTFTFNEERFYYILEHTFFPEKLNAFIPFETKKEKCGLRLTPEVDTTTDFYGLDHFGNEIAEYPKFSKGFVLAKKTNNNGAHWGFVIMLNNKFPLRGYFNTYEKEAKVGFYSFGWICVDCLEFVF